MNFFIDIWPRRKRKLMALKYWAGFNGDWSNASYWSEHAVPKAGDFDVIGSGNVAVAGQDLSNQTVWVVSLNGSAPVALSLVNQSLGNGSYISLSGTGNIAFLNINGDSVWNGSVFAWEGSSVTQLGKGSHVANNGWYAAADADAAQASSNLLDTTQGVYENHGLMEVGTFGKITMQIGSNAFNYGEIRADAGGFFAVHSSANTILAGGSIDNEGLININGGSIDIESNIHNGTGKFSIENNGTLTIGGKDDGGIITIQSGMLAFGGDQVQAPIPFLGANAFQGIVAFTGSDATLNFGDVTGLNERYDVSTNTLFVTAPFEGIQNTTGATIHLSGSYAAGEFSVQGGSVIFHNPGAGIA
jgi:hypothetical protein